MYMSREWYFYGTIIAVNRLNACTNGICMRSTIHFQAEAEEEDGKWRNGQIIPWKLSGSCGKKSDFGASPPERHRVIGLRSGSRSLPIDEKTNREGEENRSESHRETCTPMNKLILFANRIINCINTQLMNCSVACATHHSPIYTITSYYVNGNMKCVKGKWILYLNKLNAAQVQVLHHPNNYYDSLPCFLCALLAPGSTLHYPNLFQYKRNELWIRAHQFKIVFLFPWIHLFSFIYYILRGLSF